MRVILEVLKGPRTGRTFIFDRQDTFVVGRSQFVHCPINDAALSRDHFLIEINPPRCELRDLDSTNGTFVNNERIDRTRLSTGDLIAAGQSLFRIVVESTPPLPNRSPSSSMAIPTRDAIICAGCGSPAPMNLTVNNVVGAGPDEPVEWWCSACRAEVAALPQPVPHYTMIRELGRGAMGVVYQARHNGSGKMVALKLIMPETATTRAAIDRFQREMSVISQLRHENIVEWYEQGASRGQFWFAMEYVNGPNLEALANIDPGRYPTDQGCRLACQILKGLEHAHKRGFIHRDIKPENILIGQTDEGSVAKISDFGLAKSFRSVGLSGLTFSGEMRGTIPFMPPEQMTDFRTVRPQADLYATAATLYFLLTAKFIYDDPAGGDDLIKMLLEEHPIPILERRPNVPGDLAAVIGKCLSRDPEQRFPDATTMRRALKPFC
ncbi:FHA domain-containing serine/threonine-protein kinase [Paludisphaera rhizosphaerae]|uniref:FHA domain-containing serine/threonine-protein kinase n=1 Tax=Paludisphaera rhizosphaerae TaxID=2711216 RepID=UPI0013ECEA2E|nr:FHA domain-containing serine/threonine-protein kinase [Paludisphaera rhizosphaerae]